MEPFLAIDDVPYAVALRTVDGDGLPCEYDPETGRLVVDATIADSRVEVAFE